MADHSVTSSGKWFVYMVRSGDGFLYTGVTTDVERRVSEHRSSSSATASASSKSKGAKYFRTKSNLSLVFQHQVANRSIAQKLEYRIKQLGKPKKEALAAGKFSITELVTEIENNSEKSTKR